MVKPGLESSLLKTLALPKCFKKPRCDEEHVSRHSPWATAEGAVHKQTRERRKLRDQAGCGLERGSSRMSILALKSVFS